MAQSDIKYSKVSIEDEQESGNPDPIAMFKTMFSGDQRRTSSSPPQPAPPRPAQPRQQYQQPEGDEVSELELKPLSQLSKLQGRYKELSEEQQKEVDEHAARMEKMVEAKLAQMTPEQRAQFEKKQALMKKAILSQVQNQVLVANKDGVFTKMQSLGQEPEQVVRDRELLFAIRSGQADLLDGLIQKYQVDVNVHVQAPSDNEGHPLLHWASLNDQTEIISYLIDNNVNLDQRNPRGEVALHWASLNGNLRAVHQLIENGCDRTASDARGYSAMHHAAQFGRTIVLACLIRRGLNIDVRDNNGRTPLHWAAYKGEDMCAEWLLDHGANVAAEDFEQCLPIHWAALQGLTSIATLLMRYGSVENLKKKDRTGGTPAMLAREKQERYPPTSYEFKSYKKVADYMEACVKANRDVSLQNQRSMHPTWFAWPVMAPIGFCQYYTWVMPETYYYPLLTLVFWLFYWGEWVAWIALQRKDPGNYVIRNPQGQKPWRCGPFTPGRSQTGKARGTPLEETRITMDDDDGSASRPNPLQPDAQYFRQLYFEVLDKGLLVPVCTSCEIVKPLRSKHDRFTDVCVARFDHYCPFMGVAVGERNYREFFFAMFNAMVAIFAWLYMVLLYTWSYNKNQGFWSNFYEMLGWEMFAWSYLLLGMYGALMVGQHVLFIKQNITTNEVINRYRYKYLANKQNIFDRGVLSNVMEFLGLQDPVKVDVRAYYKYYFEGNSEQVERNNLNMQAMQNGGGSVMDAIDINENNNNNKSHGHSHGGRQCHGHGGHGHSH